MRNDYIFNFGHIWTECTKTVWTKDIFPARVKGEIEFRIESEKDYDLFCEKLRNLIQTYSVNTR